MCEQLFFLPFGLSCRLAVLQFFLEDLVPFFEGLGHPFRGEELCVFVLAVEQVVFALLLEVLVVVGETGNLLCLPFCLLFEVVRVFAEA